MPIVGTRPSGQLSLGESVSQDVSSATTPKEPPEELVKIQIRVFDMQSLIQSAWQRWARDLPAQGYRSGSGSGSRHAGRLRRSSESERTLARFWPTRGSPRPCRLSLLWQPRGGFIPAAPSLKIRATCLNHPSLKLLESIIGTGPFTRQKSPPPLPRWHWKYDHAASHPRGRKKQNGEAKEEIDQVRICRSNREMS